MDEKSEEEETSIEDKPRSVRSSTATTYTNRQRMDEIDSRRKTSHTPQACCTTGLWSQCCEVGTTVHTEFLLKRIQDLGSTMAQKHRL
jgi:hypothetical protein